MTAVHNGQVQIALAPFTSHTPSCGHL